MKKKACIWEKFLYNFNAFILFTACMFSWSARGYISESKNHRHKKSNSINFHEHIIRTKNIIQSSFNKSMMDIGANKVATDSLSGEVRSISGLIDFSINPLKVDFEHLIESLAHFVNEKRSIFGISKDDLVLAKNATYLGKEEQFIKFKVKRNGLVIQDSNLDFRFKHGKLVQIINESFAEAKVVSEDVRKNLTDVATSELDSISVKTKDIVLRVKDSKNGYELVKVQNFEIHTMNEEKVTLQLETQTGKVFELKNMEYDFNTSAKATLYPRWHNQPLESVKMPYLKVETNEGVKYTNAEGEFKSSSENLNPQIDGLSGKFVSISPVSGGVIRQSGIENGDGSWLIDIVSPGGVEAWLDKYIAQTMVYYYTNKIIEKAKKYIDSPWMNKTLKANVNLTKSCNAYWDGRTINFFSASNQCSNTGLISDIIFHEWGHGLDHNTGGIDDGAFSEGFGDIMSLIMTGSNLLGVGFWIPSNRPVRDLEPNKIYPDDRGEVHDEGLIIGSTFWDLFKAFEEMYGREEALEILSNYAFKMIYTADRYTKVYDALLVIDDDDGDLSNGTPHLCTLNRVFHEHGLAPLEEVCKPATIEDLQILDSDGDGYIEPSESVKIKILAKNPTGMKMSNIVGTLSIENNAGVKVLKNRVHWAELGPGDSLESDDYAELLVSSEAVCGSQFQLNVHVKSGLREGSRSYPLTMGRNEGFKETFVGQELPLPIYDLQTTVSKVSVDGQQWNDDAKIARARLKFDISHPYRGDLRVKLIGPDAREYPVYSGKGSEDNVNYDADITKFLYSNKGSGSWALSVYDKSRRDEGSLDHFELTLTPQQYTCD